MGTNYYMTVDACSSCGRGTQTIHVGKSSGGWVFSLNTHPDNAIETLDDWKGAFANHPIKDEYGDSICAAEMLRIITERQGWQGRELRRHEVDGRFCLAHGDGTYDLMRGDFS